jgi:hypothetical protein
MFSSYIHSTLANLILQRYGLVDFSHSLNHYGTFLYTGRRNYQVLGDAFKGVFDEFSFALVIIAAIAMIALVWISMRSSVAKSDIPISVRHQYCLGPSCFKIKYIRFVIVPIWQPKKRRERPGFSACVSTTYMFGSCVHQPLNKILRPKSTIARTMLCFFVLYNALMCVMYGSVIISRLTSQAEEDAINTLEDLLRLL